MNREELLLMKDKKIAVDIDLTITKDTVSNFMNITPAEAICAFEDITPDLEMIEFFNKVAENNKVTYYTARNDLLDGATNRWLDKWGVKRIHFQSRKLGYDVFIDDKAWNVDVVHKDRTRISEWAKSTLDRLSETESEIVLQPLWEMYRMLK
jgi:uncharacterized HAD superfamily protein